MDIATHIHDLKVQMVEVAEKYHRDPETIHLLAVSKGQSIEKIREAYLAGLNHFGENYLQEAEEKIKKLQSLNLYWHFIGPIQSNKTHAIAQQFSWVHSVCREKIALLLNAARPENLSPLNVCIQVKLDNEPTKQGLEANACADFISHILTLPRLQLRGLMTIPHANGSEEAQYRTFLKLSELMQQLNQCFNINMDTLSMGMSADWRAAIRAGSTFIRVGTGIFGERVAQ